MHLPDAIPFPKKAFKHPWLFKHLCLALFVPAALLSAGTAVKAQTGSERQAVSSLTVEITGIENASGEVCVSLFSGSAGFPNGEESIAEKQCTAAVETSPATISPSESIYEEDAAQPPISQLADIPAPVMENIVEGLANSAETPETGTEPSNAETSRTATTTDIPDDVVITQAVLAITFTDIAPGTYAVSVLHDENEDGELNTGTFGIPTEGFGFSKNPEIRTGAPDFSEAAIIVVGAEATTQVELIYY